MISLPLWKRELKANWKILVLFLILLSMYGSIIVAMYDPKLGESLQLMAESMPEIFAAFGMMNANATLLEFITNYLYGFILIVIPVIFIILLASRLLSRYIDRGSMAYLLATPNTRGKIIQTQAAVMVLGILTLVVYVSVLVYLCGGLMFEEGITIDKFLVLNLGLYGLLLFLGGICFLSASIFNEQKLGCGIGAGFCLLFILIQMLSQIGDKMEFLKYLTPLTLFQAEELIAFDTSSYFGVAILYICAIIFFICGIQIFKKRDLPL